MIKKAPLEGSFKRPTLYTKFLAVIFPSERRTGASDRSSGLASLYSLPLPRFLQWVSLKSAGFIHITEAGAAADLHRFP
jgi:hypothetical protein